MTPSSVNTNGGEERPLKQGLSLPITDCAEDRYITFRDCFRDSGVGRMVAHASCSRVPR
jgi:hypothetical protein